MSSVMCVRRLTEEKKEVESEIQRQPKPEVVPIAMPAPVTLSSATLHCFPPVACPVVVVVECRAEGEGADQ